jgi:hypothetical protein
MVAIATVLVLGVGCGNKKSSAEQTASGARDAAPVVDERGKNARDRAAFLVQISLTEGEKGRDSNATQTHISIMDDRLFFTETPHGGFADRRPRINVAAALGAEERAALEQSIRDLGLLAVGTIKTTKLPDGPHAYASLTAKVRLNGKEHSFALSGVTSLPGAGATAFAETSGYRAVTRLVADIGRLARAKQPAPAPE